MKILFTWWLQVGVFDILQHTPVFIWLSLALRNFKGRHHFKTQHFWATEFSSRGTVFRVILYDSYNIKWLSLYKHRLLHSYDSRIILWLISVVYTLRNGRFKLIHASHVVRNLWFYFWVYDSDRSIHHLNSQYPESFDWIVTQTGTFFGKFIIKWTNTKNWLLWCNIYWEYNFCMRICIRAGAYRCAFSFQPIFLLFDCRIISAGNAISQLLMLLIMLKTSH